MKTKKVNKLHVVECAYNEFHYNKQGEKQPFWVVDPENRNIIYSEAEKWEGTSDDFKVCGVYHKAGVPFTVSEVAYKPVAGIPAHEGFIQAVSDVCFDGLKDDKPILFTGGTCNYVPGILGGMQRALGKDTKIGIVWLDAHADMDTPETIRNYPVNGDVSLVVGGTPLAVSLGMCLDSYRLAAGLEQPINSDLVLLSDYRVSGEADFANIATTNMNVVDKTEFRDPVKWKAALEELAAKVDVILLHVDIDILSGKYVPGILSAYMDDTDGQEPDVVARNIKMVLDTGKVRAFTLANTHLDSEDPGKELLIYHSMRILGGSLENWKRYPSFL